MGSFADLLDLFGMIIGPILNAFNQFLKLLFNDMPVIYGLRPGGWLLLFFIFGFIVNLIREAVFDD